MPQRGIICSNKDGVMQLYAWDVSSNALKQLTDQPAGVVSGEISADGNNVRTTSMTAAAMKSAIIFACPSTGARQMT